MTSRELLIKVHTSLRLPCAESPIEWAYRKPAIQELLNNITEYLVATGDKIAEKKTDDKKPL